MGKNIIFTFLRLSLHYEPKTRVHHPNALNLLNQIKISVSKYAVSWTWTEPIFHLVQIHVLFFFFFCSQNYLSDLVTSISHLKNLKKWCLHPCCVAVIKMSTFIFLNMKYLLQGYRAQVPHIFGMWWDKILWIWGFSFFFFFLVKNPTQLWDFHIQ